MKIRDLIGSPYQDMLEMTCILILLRVSLIQAGLKGKS
jgi:hypothetical protein